MSRSSTSEEQVLDPVRLSARAVAAPAPGAPPGLGPQVPSRVVVLVSGQGTLLQALLGATTSAGYPVQVVAVGADRDCPALQRATEHGRPTFTVARSAHADRAAWDAALTAAVAAHDPHLVVSAGFMKVLGPVFLDRFGGRTLNTHPSLLPAFPGSGAVPAALAHGVRITGCTVHLVDAGVDTGPILAQAAVPVLAGDDVSSLHDRIKVAERALLVDTLSAVATRGLTTDGREARIP